MRGKWVGIVAGLMVVGAVFAFSEETASEHVKSEPLITESAVPVAEGDVDIEMGLTYSKADDGKRAYWNNKWSRDRADSFRMYEWTLNATVGILPDLDVSMSTGFVDVYDRNFGGVIQGNPGRGGHTRGMDDLSVALKWQMKDTGDMSIAYIPGITAPVGYHTETARNKFGSAQHYWSFDNKIAMTKELEELRLLRDIVYVDGLILNADIGYSLPFGRTRRSYEHDWGEHTEHSFAQDRSKKSGERGVLDANVALIRAQGTVRPLAELNYAHRWISRGNDSDQLHATIGSVVTIDEQMRVKLGYQHPVLGRNAARTKRLMLSVAHAF